MSEEVGHNCGIVAGHSLHDVYNMTASLENRGGDAAGFSAKRNDGGIDALKMKGPVKSFKLETLYQIFPPEHYALFTGHTRYSTTGRKEKLLDDAHPQVVNGRIENLDDHIVIRDADVSMVHNGQIKYDEFAPMIDRTKLTTDCDTEVLVNLYAKLHEENLMKAVPGTYSAIVLDRTRPEAIVMRDRHGTKPAWLAKKDGKYIVASETHAIQENGGKVVREIHPGEVVYISVGGNMRNLAVMEADPKICFFEKNYIQNPESEGVRESRFRLGEVLAREFNPGDVDIVTYVPDCPEFVAKGYAHGIGDDNKFREIFYKRRRERSFMQPTTEMQEKSIDGNLYILDNADVRNLNVMVKDDSLIRGNVIRRAVHLLKKKGAAKIYFGLATPQTGIVTFDGNGQGSQLYQPLKLWDANVPIQSSAGDLIQKKGFTRAMTKLTEQERVEIMKSFILHGCEYGVDMPPGSRFALRLYGDGTGSPENISKLEAATGATRIGYISIDGMFEALGTTKEKSCYFCIGGPRLY